MIIHKMRIKRELFYYITINIINLLSFRVTWHFVLFVVISVNPKTKHYYMCIILWYYIYRCYNVSLSRLDCGTGPGAVRTSDRVRLNQWNRLTVFRHDWGVWLQLNGGRHDEGRSQVWVFVKNIIYLSIYKYIYSAYSLDQSLFRQCVI